MFQQKTSHDLFLLQANYLKLNLRAAIFVIYAHKKKYKI